jgi:transcriptional regulator with XRE-family HTH domain
LFKTTRHPVYEALLSKLIGRRKELGWTQAELARLLGRRQPYVAKIEGGEQRVDLLEFFYWAKALKLEPSEVAKGLYADLEAFAPRRRKATFAGDGR